ncbi:MAG TPA: glycosyltransferase family 2 protein [Candidatus Saccharimonadia bacterium]|nr:glycosyltransferase family 2 protein [Candidatus Saccharimonadia bacterium]
MKEIIFFTILILCLLNLLRMAAYLVSSDAYTIRQSLQKRRRSRWHLPTISVLVPAHNEENTIERNLLSLYGSDYPKGKLEVIVVNDGSTDRTEEVVREFKRTHRDRCKIRLINLSNKGKAAALNHGLRRCAKGSLVMCLDSDSFLAPNALRSAAQHFRDSDIVALSSNVNIIEDGTLLALVQRFEYLVCYQMKKGQAFLGVEYIVGGIGSMFRRSMMKKVSFYDTNTMTEDIDLTMKIIVNKEKRQKIAYAADSIAYTEPAHSVGALMQQRFRWKFGRSQTFYKNDHLFFSRSSRHAKRLTWFMLPFSLLQDLFFFFEPAVIGYFLFLTMRYGDLRIFSSAMFVLTFYLLCNVWSSDHLTTKERLRLSYYTPPMYLLMYVLSWAEYFALIKSLLLLPSLKRSITERHVTWRSPERKRATASA